MGILESLPVQRVRPVAYWPLWCGTLLDYSGNGNNCTHANNPWWCRYRGAHGVRSDGSGVLIASADQSLIFDEITVFVYGKGLCQSKTQYFAKTAAANGFWFYGTTNSLRFWDGLAASAVVVGFASSNSVCVTSAGNNTKPEFFTDGASVGLGSVASSQSLPSSNWYLCGDASSGGVCTPISAIVVYNDILSATEIASLHEYFNARVSSIKQWQGMNFAAPFDSSDWKPLFDAYIDTARVSIGNESGGRVGECSLIADSGTFVISENTTTYKRCLECVSPGTCWGSDGSAYGTWELEYTKVAASSTLYWTFVADRVGENVVPVGYQFLVTGTETLLLRRSTGGASVTIRSTAAGFIELNVKYKFRIVRSSANLWSWYIRGGAYENWTEITTSNTDATYTTSQYTVLDMDALDCVHSARHWAGENHP